MLYPSQLVFCFRRSDEAKAIAIPLLSSSRCITYEPGGGVTLFEVYGFGEGTHISRDELVGYDFYGLLSSADGTGSFAIQKSVGVMQAAERSTHADKKEANAASSAKKEARQSAREQKVEDTKKAMDIAAARHTVQRGVVCEACRGVYSTGTTYASHIEHGVCAARQYKAELTQRNESSRRAEVGDFWLTAAKARRPRKLKKSLS